MRHASAPPDDIDTLKAMLIARAARKDGLQAEAGQLQAETATLKAELVRMTAINERAEKRIANLHMIIKQLERARSGRSSEKLDGAQQSATSPGASRTELKAKARHQAPSSRSRFAKQPV